MTAKEAGKSIGEPEVETLSADEILARNFAKDIRRRAVGEAIIAVTSPDATRETVIKAAVEVFNSGRT